eukprot:m51a1_g8271 hypothetical protein (192) ;mRNA; f:59389-62048
MASPAVSATTLCAREDVCVCCSVLVDPTSTRVVAWGLLASAASQAHAQVLEAVRLRVCVRSRAAAELSGLELFGSLTECLRAVFDEVASFNEAAEGSSRASVRLYVHDALECSVLRAVVQGVAHSGDPGEGRAAADAPLLRSPTSLQDWGIGDLRVSDEGGVWLRGDADSASAPLRSGTASSVSGWMRLDD